MKTILIEYSYDLERVIVRGVWEGPYAVPTPLPTGKASKFNMVTVIENTDMRSTGEWLAGFADLVPSL